ncbi:MAG: lysophospholipid acyltransferase family protein [Aeromicrobium sp.]
MVTYGLLVLIFRIANLVGGHRTIRVGTGRLPAGGAVLAINHTSYVDFTYLGISARSVDRRYIRFMGKAELRRNLAVRWLMRGCKVIPVDRAAGHEAYVAAVGRLRDGEIVGIYPEATISRSFEIKELKSGAARMALEADVPIIPAVVWGSQRILPKGGEKHLGRTRSPVMVSIGAPVPPAGTAEELTLTLRDAMTTLLHEVQDAYGPHPAGQPWVPARLGGSAPTLAEADLLDAREHR